VRAADIISRVLITICGIGTIIAVGGVCIFLVVTAAPLFFPAKIESQEPVTPPSGTVLSGEKLIGAGIDEDQQMVWVLSRPGTLTLFRTSDGSVLLRKKLFDGPVPTAYSRLNLQSTKTAVGTILDEHVVAFGFADGSIRVGTIEVRSSFPKTDKVPREIREQLDASDTPVPFGAGLVLRTREGLLRQDELVIDLPTGGEPPSSAAVLLLDQIRLTKGSAVCSLGKDGKLRYQEIERAVNEFDPDLPPITKIEKSVVLPLASVDSKPPPDHLVLSQDADHLFLIWNEGRYVRYNLRNPEKAVVAERGSLALAEGVQVTAIQQLIGRSTLLVGDSSGTVSAWFLIKPRDCGTLDGTQLVRGHQLPGPANRPVTALDISSRGRLVSIGYSNGHVRLYNVTSQKRVAVFDVGVEKPVLAPILAPNADGIVALTSSQGRQWRFDIRHPEITLGSLFGKVWYEGSEKPVHKWESSSGNDAYEPKYGMVPLIYGTLKATFYSLLFGVPLALLAAIYTSEFMKPRARAIVKPVIEMMASLPSVVLGFLAGLVFAQFVEDKVPTILCAFLLVPLTFALLAQFVQLIPERISLPIPKRRLFALLAQFVQLILERLSLAVNRARFLFFVPAVGLGLLGAMIMGPVVESIFFAGDLRAWLVNPNASSVGGWMLLFVPLGLLLNTFLMGGIVTPWLRRVSARWGRIKIALLDLVRFLVGCVLALGFALGASLLVGALGFDARGSFIATYSQRNMLVTGFAMGFAIIPIIFTIADDALSAVPSHLRSGSLAAGASPWQTAVRIVLPTAMSGLFSAVMIGTGRAAGETMIVLMASGNTPVMNLNIFDGCRTLAANIAVEIPEAPPDGTLYRTLFVAALLLFAMTFVLNTIAELVRLRFRRRAYQL
jgi:phosphate transport system permease protein